MPTACLLHLSPAWAPWRLSSLGVSSLFCLPVQPHPAPTSVLGGHCPHPPSSAVGPTTFSGASDPLPPRHAMHQQPVVKQELGAEHCGGGRCVVACRALYPGCTQGTGPSKDGYTFWHCRWMGLEAAGQAEGSKGVSEAAHVLLVTAPCLPGLRTQGPPPPWPLVVHSSWSLLSRSVGCVISLCTLLTGFLPHIRLGQTPRLPVPRPRPSLAAAWPHWLPWRASSPRSDPAHAGKPGG